jgi:hypothetical protein
MKMEVIYSSETFVDFQQTSVVGIATSYCQDDRGFGVRVSVESRIFPVGTGGCFPGVKRAVREADHSPPTSAEVKKMWIYTSTPPYAFMA